MRPGEYSFNASDQGVTANELAALDPDAQVQRITSMYAALVSSAPPGEQPRAYALSSPVQAQYAEAYALDRPRNLRALEAAFLRSPYWQVAFQDDGTILFQLDVSRYLALDGAGG